MRATNFASDPALLMSACCSAAAIGIVLVASDHEIDLGKPGGERAILGERQVRDGHDGVGAAALEHGDVLRGGLHRIDEPETPAHARRNLAGREAQTDESDFE
jgi:hypothetical protein